ncbi:prephenate dehydrogenase [Sphaerisporangium sp. TRM90804]|uniref:prephenate dehydrogenase n=1 Tax=Sphaerisporangium sp. TRM90804 TaxID=3031113 RepID=UPI002448FA45|nr:prephenate dehydrogenase [Sphaerisporangium sp. TRM90804]MDH2424521.1 prephenate dehydrogenase [Sphaerisporangium sp. TRM90804]
MKSLRIRRVTVIGTGVIGTSIALGLRRAGVHVALADRDTASLAQAQLMGAGVALAPGAPAADVVVIATPPSTIAAVLRDAQARGLGAVYTDVASTKGGVLADVERAGCDLTTFVPGHPMAGREISGPAAGRAELFEGRPWALCPHPDTTPEAVRLVAELVAVCGAESTVLAPDAHDRAVAATSHAPHVISAALAARFAGADQTALSLVGTGLRDTTRIANGAPGLWVDILDQNAESVADVLDAVVRDLTRAASALRGGKGARHDALADLLTRGNIGREHIVGASRRAETEERTLTAAA